MINLTVEKLITFTEATALIPGRGGKRVSLSTLTRWALKGVRRNSGRVRLEFVRIGGRCMTSHEAIARFATALTASQDGSAATCTSDSPNTKTIDRALDQMGI